jgi:hypothetical protein
MVKKLKRIGVELLFYLSFFFIILFAFDLTELKFESILFSLFFLITFGVYKITMSVEDLIEYLKSDKR